MTDVTARVRYINDEWKERTDRAFIYSKETRHANTSLREVQIYDARPLHLAGQLHLDSNGFVFTECDFGVSDFHDDEAVRSCYDQALVPMLKSLTGASEVRVSGHQVRTEDPWSFLGAYSRYLHCDYPLSPSPKREAGVLGRDFAGEDYAWFNIWSPIDRPAEQNQLTMLDARTLSMDDICDYNFTEHPDNGYAAIPAHNPNHRFFYFPKMKPGEAVIFKQFDSRSERAMACPHTAFYHPDVGDSAAARRSVEFRALCIFD